MTLNNVLDHVYLTDIYRAFHPKEAKHTFLSKAHGTLSKTDNIKGHKKNPKPIQENRNHIMQFSEKKGLKLETNQKEKTQK